MQLLETVRPASGPGVAPPEGSAAIDKIVDEISERHGVDSAKLRTVSAEMTVKRQRLAEDLARRVGEQAPALAGILESRNVAAQQSPEQEQSAARATAMTALRDHWWVQLNAAGEWSDLDPSLPTAAPGQCVSKATQTVAKGQIDETLRSLGLAHEIVIRVVIERWNGGKLEQAPVLEQKLQRP